MKKLLTTAFILFFYVVLDSRPVFTYDQVTNEKTIPLVSKKAEPTVLRIDKEKALWILDRSNLTIQKISKEGKTEVSIKPGKKKEDPFRDPVDFVFAPDGSLVVADPGFDRVVFVEKGKLVREIAVQKPSAVAVSRDDILAVGSMDQKDIQIFSKDGVPLHQISPPEVEKFASISALVYSIDGTLWALDGAQGKLHRFGADKKWKGVTSGLGECAGLAVDEFGFAYVTDVGGRWKEINKDGAIAGKFGAKGKNPGQLNKPYGIALESSSRLWVAEQGNLRLQVFGVTNAMKQLALTPQPAARIQVRRKSYIPGLYKMGTINAKGEILLFNQKKNVIDRFDADGKGLGPITLVKGKEGVHNVEGMAQDNQGRLWVSDEGDHKIKRIAEDGSVAEVIGQKGKQEGSLKSPTFLAIRPDQSFVVADRGNSRVQVLSPKGLFLFSVGGTGKVDGRFKTVSGLAATATTIGIIDNDIKAVLFYDANGKLVKSMANQETVSYWKELASITTDLDGRFYVVDKEARKVRLFGPSGDFIADFSTEGHMLAVGGPRLVLVLADKGAHLYSLNVVPTPIENLKVEDQAGNIQVSWNKNPDSAQYRVFRSSISNIFNPLITSSATSTFDADVVPGVTYRYSVTGVNELGYEGNWVFSDPIKASRRKDVSLISITSTTFNPIFTAAFKSYISKPIGTITIKNNDSQSYRDVKISMSLKNYTDFATDTVVKIIEAGQELQVPVTMTFNDAVLELTENTPVQVDVRLTYFEDNSEKIVSQNAPLLLYSRNAISWTESDRISSFITPRDVPIADFSRAAIRSFLKELKTATIGKPLAKVALLYESVNALGMSYVPDPKTPYAEVSGKPDTLDYVQFPRETLRRKIGDCDDTTALMASLLESIGVETAVVDIPGHVFVMANLEDDNVDFLGFPAERFIEFHGSMWVPIETTKFGKGFEEAWQSAATRVKAAKDKNEIKYVSVLEASKKYPPVTLKETASEITFPEAKVKAAYVPLLDKLQKQRTDNQLAAIKAKITRNPADAMLLVQMGMIQAEGGNVAEARNIFTTSAKDPSVDVQAAAHNNLGNLDYLAGDFKSALQHYNQAATLMPTDGGIAINQARAAWRAGDMETAKKSLEAAKSELPEWKDFVTDLPAELLPK